MDVATGFPLLRHHFLRHAPPAGLDSASDCDAHLSYLTVQKRARVEPIHIEIISLVVEWLDNPNSVGKIVVYELSLLAIVYTPTEGILFCCVIAQTLGCTFPFRYWRKETTTFVVDDALIYRCGQ